MHRFALPVLLCLVFALCACAPAKVTLFPDGTDPLTEYTIEGDGEDKILVVQLRGVISTNTRSGVLRDRASVIEELSAQLDKASDDEAIRALLLVVDSPGGTSTGSAIAYTELQRYKERTGATVVASQLSVATSGGYFACLPADHIMAHPSTITGSIGTIFMQPKVMGLAEMVGVQVEITASGEKKDMFSPFRATSRQEQTLITQMIRDLNSEFITAVRANRPVTERDVAIFSDARILTASQAKDLHLVDSIGFLPDAIDTARELSGAGEDARVVVYRRQKFANDTLYNARMNPAGSATPTLLPGIAGWQPPSSGFYHLWPSSMLGAGGGE